MLLGWVVMPSVVAAQACDVVRFRRRCFAIAIVIAVVSDLGPGIGHVRQVPDVVVGELVVGFSTRQPASWTFYASSHHRHCAS